MCISGKGYEVKPFILRFSKDLWGSFVDVMLRTVGVVVMCYSWYFSFNLVYQETPVRIGTGCVSDLIWRGPSFIMRIIWDFFLIWGKAHDRALWGTRALQSCCNGEHEKFCDWLCFVSWSRALRRSSGTFSSFRRLGRFVQTLSPGLFWLLA